MYLFQNGLLHLSQKPWACPWRKADTAEWQVTSAGNRGGTSQLCVSCSLWPSFKVGANSWVANITRD